MSRRYLADTSAWARAARPAVSSRWERLIEQDALAICAPVRLELLYTAPDEAMFARIRRDVDALPQVVLDSSTGARAEDVQASLVRRGHHRGPTPVDLLVAAAAEASGLTLLHYDRHFDLIVEVTGQPAEWLARRGTLD